MDNKDFTHLHLHTEFSILDGFGSAASYATRAKELGFTRLAITDHGNVDGALAFQRACDGVGIKHIFGCEGYIVPNLIEKKPKEKRNHITLLAKNKVGWENLLKLLTYANLQGFYYRPRIDPSLLLEYCEGIVVMTACSSGFLTMSGGTEMIEDLLAKRVDVYAEIMPIMMEEQTEINEICMYLADSLGIKLVASNDCHYPLAEQSMHQEVLLAMQSKTTWKDPNRWKFSVDDLYLKTADEMLESFKRQGCVPEDIARQAILNTMEVADLCNFRLEPIEPSLPIVYVPEYEDLDETDQIISLAMDGLEKRAHNHEWIREDIDIYRERLEDEFSHIIPQFTRYFLIVWELVTWCEKNDIMLGPGRGSSSGSLVSYCLGITHADPIKYKLIFSRFISPGRIDLPDIDLDFEDIKRPLILGHLEEMYGKWNVLEVSNFLKMKGRGAITDVSRVFSVPIVEVRKAANCIVSRTSGDFRADFDIKDAFETFEDGMAFRNKYPEVTDMAISFEGAVKATGRHAAAMCVSSDDFRSGKNAVIVMRKGHKVCNWSKDDAEFMGLMKLDILGLNGLTILNQSRKLVFERHGVDIDYNLVDLEDHKLLDQFTKGNTIGIFQFNSPGMIKLCRDIHADSFEDVAALNALHRPGALRSGMTQVFRNRKHGLEDTVYIHPWIKGITEDTHGLIIYQEQVMRLMYELGGLPWKTADTIRKVISKSKGVEEFLKFEQDFIDGCKRLGTLSEEDAHAIFDELKNMGSYSFNLSHACTYAMIAMWMMYLKVYYPIEFMCTTLSYGPDKKKLEQINEAKRLEIKVLLPDINLSDATVWKIDEENNLIAPFREIKGVGEKAASKIVEEREANGPYLSQEDLEKRTPSRPVTSKVRRLLVEAKAYSASEEKLNLTEEELEELANLFDFELSNNPLYRYKGMVRRINEQLDINPIRNSDGQDHNRYYFGRVERLTVGYREAITQKVESDRFGSLGSIYGSLRDDTDFKMIVFGAKLYEEKKYEIEHCDGRAMLTYAGVTRSKSALITQQVWFGDDLLEGKAERLNLELAEFSGDGGRAFRIEGLSDCVDCELRSECKAPVQPTSGELNVMAIGEGPGRSDDRIGAGFSGTSGEVLDKALFERGIDRSLIHISNVVKCFPSKTRTPKKNHVDLCSKWLRREIELVNPFLILAFGNTANLFFRGESTGIMNLNGKTIWNDEHKCWITYCIHPATVTYDIENKELFDKGMDEFSERLSCLGFGE